MKTAPRFAAATALLAGAVGLAAGSADAAEIPVVTTYGFSTTNLAQLTDHSEFTLTDPNDPGTWVDTSGNWTEESFGDYLVGATNGKLGWYAFDLGSAKDLDEIFVFVGSWQGGPPTGNGRITLKSFNVHLATTPGVALSNGGDYDFSGSGWSQLGGTQTASSTGEIMTVAAAGQSARYIGIEIMSDWNSSDERTGFDEFAVTEVPEPSSLALLAMGGLLIARRRRG